MRSLLQDLRLAMRGLRSNPGVTIVAVASLALGIGANTTIFSALDAMLIRPLPYPGADRLVQIWSTEEGGGDDGEINLSIADFEDFRRASGVFEQAAAYQWRGYNLSGDKEPERVRGLRVSEDFFSLFGAEPVVGRGFLPEETTQKDARVALISERLWERRFGRDPAIVGGTLRLDGEPFTVTGVVPADFKFPNAEIQLWTPLVPDPAEDRGARYAEAVGRLREGLSLSRARSEIGALASRLATDHPETNAGTGAHLVPLVEELYGELFKLGCAIAAGAVLCVLLIACVNVANLMLVRSAAREREVAVRAALGAGRMRVVRQLLTESVLLALIGGVLGTLLALWGIPALKSIIPAEAPRVEDMALNLRALAATAALALVCGLLFGLAPALHVSRPRLVAALREGGRGATGGPAATRLRGALVVAEIALALVLLVSTGLLIRGFLELRSQQMGFRPGGILTWSLFPPESRYAGDAELVAFYESLQHRLADLPRVEAAELTSILPMAGSSSDEFEIEGQPTPGPRRPILSYKAVSPGYLAAIGVPLVGGRWFTDSDRPGAPEVVLVNDAFVRRYFNGESPLGKRLLLPKREPERPAATGAAAPAAAEAAPVAEAAATASQDGGDELVPHEIVGVVGDVREWGFDVAPPPMAYVPYLQRMWRNMDVIVRAAGVPPDALAPAVRTTIAALDPDQPILNMQTMDAHLERVLQGDGILAKILAVLAGVALVLAGVGIYGVVAYSVSRRTHEIGIRMAIGARAGNVMRLVLRQGLTIAALGVGIGLVGAVAITRFLTGFLFGVSPFDPGTFMAVALGLTAVALLASVLPARRASLVDPVVALRTE